MTKLLKKELTLCMHPTAPIMLLLSCMVIIPNYPYSVIFFYISLSIFFTCLLGRENNDVVYSLMLPISKKDIVKARFTYTVLLEILQLIIMIPFIFLSRVLNTAGNEAGTDACITLYGVAFIIYGVFNLVFYLSYYKNVRNVGVAFVKSSIVCFLLVTAEVVASYAIPFYHNKLDTRDPQFLTEKLIFAAVGLIIFAILTFAAYKKSVTNFEKQDL